MTKRKRNTKTTQLTTEVKIRRPDAMYQTIEAAMHVIDSDEAATMVEGHTEAGLFVKASTDVWRMLYQVLATNKRIRDHQENRDDFAKGQLLCANLIQNAYAAGMRAAMPKDTTDE